MDAKKPESEILANFSLTWEKYGEGLAIFFARFSSFNFQEKWAQENSRKNPRQIRRAMKQNSFTGETLGAWVRNALSTAGNSMTSSERPSPAGADSGKRGVPSRTEGERNLEML